MFSLFKELFGLRKDTKNVKHAEVYAIKLRYAILGVRELYPQRFPGAIKTRKGEVHDKIWRKLQPKLLLDNTKFDFKRKNMQGLWEVGQQRKSDLRNWWSEHVPPEMQSLRMVHNLLHFQEQMLDHQNWMRISEWLKLGCLLYIWVQLSILSWIDMYTSSKGWRKSKHSEVLFILQNKKDVRWHQHLLMGVYRYNRLEELW